MSIRKMIDIGANLTDSVFQGVYNGREKHRPDVHDVIQRSFDSGVKAIIITGTNLDESTKACSIASTDKRLFSTVGCHPTCCGDFLKTSPEQYVQSLSDVITNNQEKVVAIGEIGLDYDRTHFCPADVQQRYFDFQIQNLCTRHAELPLFVHDRNATDDLLNILQKNRHRIHKNIVVHSFTGTKEEAQKILDFGCYIGINGCSLKTNDNLDVLRLLPLDKILIETDSPWCTIRKSSVAYQYIRTHFESVKSDRWVSSKLVSGRNEPCNLIQVAEVIAAVKLEDINDVLSQILSNTLSVFPITLQEHL